MKARQGKVEWNGDPFNGALGEGRYQDALRRFRTHIADGAPLDLDDCNVTGMKHTSASWGLCSDDPAMWPDPEDHIFPVDFLRRKRVTERDMQGSQRCPMERELNRRQFNSSAGCFYRCDLFRPKRGASNVDQAEAVRRYDALIAEREVAHGRRTSADDGEEGWREVDEARARRSETECADEARAEREAMKGGR